MKKAKQGRPTKYKRDYAKQAAKLAGLGAIDRDLADFFEVNEDTIHQWKKDYPIFSESIKAAKANANAAVRKSLYKRALGLTVTVERLSKDGEAIACTEELPPDTRACQFWLSNREPDEWRNKQDHTVDIPELYKPVLKLVIPENKE